MLREFSHWSEWKNNDDNEENSVLAKDSLNGWHLNLNGTNKKKVLFGKDLKWILHYNQLEPEKTVTMQLYSEQLACLKDRLFRKRYFLFESQQLVIFLYNNVCHCVANTTQLVIIELGWEILPHLMYSPNLSYSDHHLFHSRQHFLLG